MKPIAYYITAHGYGHGTRSCDVLRALHRLAPGQPVIVTTDLPRGFLDSRLGGCGNITFRSGAFDVGLVQKDSLQSDLFQTLEELEALNGRWEALIAQERLFIQHEGIGLVAADIPAIPLAAAQRSGIPDVAIGNFSWDWIYETYASTDFQWEFFVEKFRAVYEQTGLLLRLPFAPPMEQFPNRKDIPLLASPGRSRREDILNSNPEIRNRSGHSNIVSSLNPRASDLPPVHDRPWVLLSFTSLDLDARAVEKIGKLSGDYEFFCVEPMSFPGSCIHSIRRDEVCFADILASCDIVVSKPGFGLVSECIVNRKPLVWSDRGEFAEYPYLVEGIGRYLKNAFLPSEKLYAGELRSGLEAVQNAPEPDGFIGRSGAEQAAEELLRLTGRS